MGMRRLVRVVWSGTDEGTSAGRRCPRCGGPLERNSGGPGDSAIFAASPPEELCVPCLTGHSSGWVPPAREPNSWLGGELYGNRLSQWLRQRRDSRENQFMVNHDAAVQKMRGGT